MDQVILEVLKGDGWHSTKVEIGKPEDFEILEDDVEKALCSAGNLLSYYGLLAADLKAQAARKKSDLESYDSELALTIRSSEDKKRITEGMISNTIKADSRHKELFYAMIEAERDSNKVENLFRALQKKADCAIAISYTNRVQWKNA